MKIKFFKITLLLFLIKNAPVSIKSIEDLNKVGIFSLGSLNKDDEAKKEIVELLNNLSGQEYLEKIKFRIALFLWENKDEKINKSHDDFLNRVTPEERKKIERKIRFAGSKIFPFLNIFGY